MTRSLTIAIAAGAALWMGSAAIAQTSSEELPEIREYVQRVFFEGIPYEEASRYEAAATLPALLEMLEDSQQEQHWPNVAVMLGIVGDEQALDPLISFIDKDVEGILSPAHYRAKTSALMSMGYLIHRSQSERALEYLKERASPATWEEAGVLGASPFTTEDEVRNQDLAKYAVLGLALSGHPEAGAALEALQEAALSPSATGFQAQIGGMLAEALAANRAIAEQGLVRYYEDKD